MKKSKLPKTDSIQELAEFWDTHDLTDFEEELEEVAEPVFMRGTARIDSATAITWPAAGVVVLRRTRYDRGRLRGRAERPCQMRTGC